MAVGPSSNSEESENETNSAIRRQCNRWMHEYMAFSAWETFIEHDTVETSTKNIIWGLHQGDLLDQELIHGQVQLLTLICTISTNTDGWERWIEEEGVLPLEKSADIVRELVEEYSVLAEDNAEVVKETEIQAVLECCRVRQFRLARDVLTRIWKRGRGEMEKDTYRRLMSIVENRSMKDQFVGEHLYDNYLMQVKQHLGKAFASMDQPWLKISAECCLRRLAAPAERQPKSPEKPNEHGSDSWPRQGRIPARFIKPNNLHIASQDVENIREFVRGNKDGADVGAAKSNVTVVQREMRNRINRKKASTRKKSASRKQTTRRQNSNNNNKNIIQELDKAINRLDCMKQQRLDSEMAFIKERLPTGAQSQTGHILLDVEDESGESDGPPSKRIKPLPEMPKQNLKNLQIQLSPRQPRVRLRRKGFWTEEETDKLRKGVETLGVGHWAEIKEMYKLHNRTSVNLKDRWRNICNVQKQQ